MTDLTIDWNQLDSEAKADEDNFQEKERKPIPLLPEGVYKVKIKKAEQTVSAAGNTMIAVTYKVVGGIPDDYPEIDGGKLLFDFLVPAFPRFFLEKLPQVMGEKLYQEARDENITDLDDLAFKIMSRRDEFPVNVFHKDVLNKKTGVTAPRENLNYDVIDDAF